jgi:rhodanese-related sulfurtransferase
MAWYEKPEMAYPIAGTVLCVLLALLVAAPQIAAWWRARGREGVLDPVQADEIMGTNAPLVLDLREPLEFKGKLGHIKGTLPMPYAEVGKRLEELRSKEPRPILIVDTTCKRSYIIADYLRSKGFDWVYVLKGGLRAWKKARLPLYH